MALARAEKIVLDKKGNIVYYDVAFSKWKRRIRV